MFNMECTVCSDENLHEVVLNGINKNRIWLMLTFGGSDVRSAFFRA